MILTYAQESKGRLLYGLLQRPQFVLVGFLQCNICTVLCNDCNFLKSTRSETVILYDQGMLACIFHSSFSER